MSIVNYTLLREKFTIQPENKERRAIAAMSNRLTLALANETGMIEEHYIIRAHNMHLCTRIAGRMLREFKKAGPLSVRGRAYWQNMWEDTLTPYDKAHNPDRWAAVYKDGNIVFAEGNRHAFLDVIEKCDLHEDEDYKKSLTLAEKAFRAAGQDVHIKHESNIAMILDIEGTDARCSLIIRSATQTKTFALFLQNTDGEELNHAHIITAASAYLEGVELCFLIGMNNMKMEMGMITSPSAEEHQTHLAEKRLGQLQTIIDGMEKGLAVRYRPEKPRFDYIITSTEIIARQSLKAFHGEFE